MTKKVIYGVDITREVTPVMVRDAVMTCFLAAHKDILEEMKDCSEFESEEEFEEIKRIDIKVLLKDAFAKGGGDYEFPDKDSLLKVIAYLKEYALNFRHEKIVGKHFLEIKKLIDKLD